MQRLNLIALAATITLVHGCTETTGPEIDLAPGSVAFAISDAANDASVTGFYFLPPLVSQPTYSGVFDATQTPEVRIACTGASGPVCPLATLAASVVPGEEKYRAVWKTSGKIAKEVELGPGKYRIEVHNGGEMLGYADLWLVAKPKDLQSVSSDYIGAVMARLTIDFRIETSEPPPPPPGDFASVSAGHGRFTCALTPAGQAYCWGSNNRGQLGDGTTDNRHSPTAVLQPAGVSFTQISAGTAHTCALTAAGQAYCWGNNVVGELGSPPDLSTDPVTAPRAVVQGAVAFASIVATNGRTCALDNSGQAYCWGNNADGTLGVGVTPIPTATATLYITRPQAVVMPTGVTFSHLSGNFITLCGLSAAGQAYCWGPNTVGQVGDGTRDPRLVPTAVAQPAGVTFAMVEPGVQVTCALAGSGSAYCWGQNSTGPFGNGELDNSSDIPVPAATSGGPWQAIRTGSEFGCAINTSGRVYCWGSSGKLGNGAFGSSTVPVETLLPEGRQFPILSTGDIDSCAISDTGELYCWGQNLSGAVGDGTTTTRLTPVRIELP